MYGVINQAMNKSECFNYERDCQSVMNSHYIKWGIVDRSGACELYDLALYMESGKIVYVEEKFRQVDYGDFLLELIQDVESCNLGWFYKTKASHVFYIVALQTIYSIDWDSFRKRFREIQEDKKLFAQTRLVYSLDGFGCTINISIPWNLIDGCYNKINLPWEAGNKV